MKKCLSSSILEDDSLKLDQASEINKMNKLINTTKERIVSWREEVGRAIKDQNYNPLQLKVLFGMYENEEQKFLSYHEKLDNKYEREIKLLSEKKREDSLPQGLKSKLENEFTFLSKSLDLGLRGGNQSPFDFVLTDNNFEELRANIKKDCLFTIDNEECSKKKELSFIHALSLLMSLKIKDLKNDIKLVFSLLLLSYGVGQRLMNMLCRMRVTYNWKVTTRFLDNYIERKVKEIHKLTDAKVPLVFLIDHINMYRGSKKYLRLFKLFGPKMWNFTGRGLLVPHLSGIEHLFCNKETATESQRDIHGLTADEILIGSNMEHLRMWQTWLDYYLLVSLNEALSKLPRDTDLKKMSEKDFEERPSKRVYEKDNPKYKIIPPSPKSLFSIENVEAMKLYRLTLSFENNATVSGTGGILYEFAKNFGMPSCEIREFCHLTKVLKLLLLNMPESILNFKGPCMTMNRK